MVEIGLLLALAAAATGNLAFLCKHRGATAAPDVRFRHPWQSTVALFRSRWWTIGFGIAAVAWGLHVAALALAPLSLVQAVMAAGLVLLAVFAQRWFGLRLGRREVVGLGLSAGGLALLAVTLAGTAKGAHASYSVSALIAFEAGAIALGVLLLLSGTATRARVRQGMLLGAAGGLLLGVSTVALKALAGNIPADPLSLISPWAAIAAGAGIGAFFALARALQTGGVIGVVALTSVGANCSAILGGILVFGDPMGGDGLTVVARGVGFAAIVVAAALIPEPRSWRPTPTLNPAPTGA